MTWTQNSRPQPKAPELIPADRRRDLADLAQRKADAPLKPAKPQEACDIGLFSDQPRQLDLVTLANTARKP